MEPTLALAVLAAALGPSPYEAMLRIVLAAFFGGLIGWEREVRGRAAGLTEVRWRQ